MREITLDARLARAFEMVPECRVCADIGADHGFLPAQLLMSSRVQRMHICDISAPSLDKARRLFAGDALESRAVFGVGDIYAIGAMHCAMDHGFAVPDDFSFAGVDDIILSKYISVPLTTIGYDKIDIGRLAMAQVMDMINGKKGSSTER